MFCSTCGTQYQTEANFCQKCGGQAATPASVVAGDQAGRAIWNPNAAASWSLLFTPAFGAYLQMLNWRALGEPEKSAASKNWFYGSLAMLAVTLLLAVVMSDSKAADTVTRGMGIGFLVAWYRASGREQSKYVKAKFGKEYVRQPWAKALLIGVGGIVAYFVVAFVVGFVASFAQQA